MLYNTTVISAGDIVRIKCDKYTNGQIISEWEKSRAYRVAQIKLDKVLLAQTNGWVLIKDIQKV